VAGLTPSDKKRNSAFVHEGSIAFASGLIAAIGVLVMFEPAWSAVAAMAALVSGGTFLLGRFVGGSSAVGDGGQADEPEMMLAMRGASDGLWVWNIETDQVTITPRINEVLGTDLPLTGITSEQLFSNFHPDDRDALSNEIIRHMRGETPFFVCDYRVVQPDGSIRWVEDRGIAERNEDGKVVRMGGSVTGITRRKEAEERLARSQMLLQAVINNTPSVIYIKDPNGNYILVNRQFEMLFGVSADDVVGKTDSDFFPEEVTAVFRANDRKVLQTLKPLAVEEIVPLNTTTFLSVKFPLLDDEGQCYAVCGISTDITDRKKMEEDLALSHATLEAKVKARTQELETSEKRFKDYAETGSDWFWETGPNHQFKSASEAFVRLTGIPRQTLHTQTRRDLAYIEDLKENPGKWDAHEADFEAHREFKDFEYPLLTTTGRLMHIRVSGRPFYDADGTFMGFRGVGTDVTSEKQAEAALREAKQQADKANQAKSEFLSRMSHELRTPLNGILGFTQLLELDSEENLTPEQVRFIGDIRRSGDHLLELINEVLDLARIESGGLDIKLEPLDPAEVMNECLDMIMPMADKTGIHIADGLNLGQEGAGVISDRVRLRQVFVNLVTNAIKYNRINGSVQLRFGNGPKGFQRICITDTGLGIPKENLEEIFQPFTRLSGNQSVEGTGVGLAVTRKLVELLGGDLGVESTPGEGSNFWVDIPLNDGRLALVENNVPTENSGKTESHKTVNGNKRILYVEDNKANIRFMRELLKRIPNVDVVIAETGEDGIRLVREQSPDLVLMDINLPGMNGYDALLEIRRSVTTSALPVLALSAFAMPEDVKKGLDAGFDGYLTKPLNVGETLTAIFDALD